jgi:hypothetical protein
VFITILEKYQNYWFVVGNNNYSRLQSEFKPPALSRDLPFRVLSCLGAALPGSSFNSRKRVEKKEESSACEGAESRTDHHHHHLWKLNKVNQ